MAQHLRFSFLIALAFLLACAGPQQMEAPAPTEAEPDPTDTLDIRVSEYDVGAIEYPDLPPLELPDVEQITLDNGLTIYLLEDRELPLIRASALVGTGSVYEPGEKTGLASITGTVMRTGGTASHGPDEINQTLEAVGASVETSIGETTGSASMSTLREHIDTVLPIFAEVLTRPAFAEEQVQLAKSQQRSAISRRNDDPQQIAFREFSKILYGPDSPYGRTTEYYTIDAIEREDLAAFHEQYYHPNNTILSVWGDFDAEAMADRLREAFGDWERAEGFEQPTPPEPRAERGYGVHFIQKDDVTQSTILIGHPGELTRDHPDYFPVIVMNEVLSGGFSGRLFRNVRSAQGLAYSVFGSYGAGYERPGQFYAGLFTRSEATLEATRAVLEEIEKLREAPPTEEEIQMAQDAYLNSFVFNFDTRGKILNRLMTYDYYDYPQDFLEQVRQGVQEVTAEDVHRVAQRYLHPDDVDILVLGRQQDFDEPVEALTRDGSVNEVDISIPTSPPGEEAEEAPATEEDRARGREALLEVREALGGAAFDQLESLHLTSETQINMPQGEQSFTEDLLLAFDPERYRMETTLPNGLSLTFANDGEEMRLQSPQGVGPAPPPLQQQARTELGRNLVYLMRNLDEAEVEDRGTETIGEETLRALRIRYSADNVYTLYVDPQTMRPVRMHFQETNLQTGASFEAENVFEEFDQIDGITLPVHITSYQNGEQAAVVHVTRAEVNVDVSDEDFAL